MQAAFGASRHSSGVRGRVPNSTQKDPTTTTMQMTMKTMALEVLIVLFLAYRMPAPRFGHITTV